MPGEREAPSLYDIGYGLYNTYRFGGHVKERWTVYDHSLAVLKMLEMQGADPIAQLYGLLHDAHEAITGDIPYPWKTDDMRSLQSELDDRIYRSLGLNSPDGFTIRVVKHVDEAVMPAEASRIGPPGIKEDCDPSYSYVPGNAVDSVLMSDRPKTADEAGKEFERLVLKLVEEVKQL